MGLDYCVASAHHLRVLGGLDLLSVIMTDNCTKKNGGTHYIPGSDLPS